MTTLIDNPSGEWLANEVYEIQATDPVEGAATGASFGGIGLDNQPHQQLSNRTAYLKQRQDTNIANIAALQGEFASLGTNNAWSNVAVYTAPGAYSFVTPPGVALVHAIVVGAGGGGAPCSATSPQGSASGGGGGAGAYSEGFVTVAPAEGNPLTVGRGGGSGTGGGDSSFGQLTGGGGGGAVFQDTGVSAGGSGGSAIGGAINFAGGFGSDGQSGSLTFAGNGAAGPWGGSGRAGLQRGLPGLAPGAGGGGAYDSAFTGRSYDGGSGASGAVIIFW